MLGYLALLGIYPVLAYSSNKYLTNATKSKILKKAGLIGENDTLWCVGSGFSGTETLGSGKHFSKAIGIDPYQLFDGNIGKYSFLKKSIEDVLADPSITRPDFVMSNNFFGIHEVLNDFLEMKTEPTIIIEPCGCKSCVEQHYKIKQPKSQALKEYYPDQSYWEINSNNPTEIYTIDLEELSREAGYDTHIRKKRFQMKKRFRLIITKDEKVSDVYNNS